MGSRTDVPKTQLRRAPPAAPAGIVGGMTDRVDHEVAETFAEASARVGVVVTEEGKARARRRLAAAEEGWTPERRNAERAKLGLPARAA